MNWPEHPFIEVPYPPGAGVKKGWQDSPTVVIYLPTDLLYFPLPTHTHPQEVPEF